MISSEPTTDDHVVDTIDPDPIEQNDLFVSPIDISDHNIPNGNSIFLINCKKAEKYILNILFLYFWSAKNYLKFL